MCDNDIASALGEMTEPANMHEWRESEGEGEGEGESPSNSEPERSELLSEAERNDALSNPDNIERLGKQEQTRSTAAENIEAWDKQTRLDGGGDGDDGHDGHDAELQAEGVRQGGDGDHRTGCCGINFTLLPLKVVNFFFFGAAGAAIPYLSVYLQHQRLTASETGVITGMTVLLACLFRPLMGFLADLFHARRPLLPLCCLVFGATFCCLWFVPKRPMTDTDGAAFLCTQTTAGVCQPFFSPPPSTIRPALCLIPDPTLLQTPHPRHAFHLHLHLHHSRVRGDSPVLHNRTDMLPGNSQSPPRTTRVELVQQPVDGQILLLFKDADIHSDLDQVRQNGSFDNASVVCMVVMSTQDEDKHDGSSFYGTGREHFKSGLNSRKTTAQQNATTATSERQSLQVPSIAFSQQTSVPDDEDSSGPDTASSSRDSGGSLPAQDTPTGWVPVKSRSVPDTDESVPALAGSVPSTANSVPSAEKSVPVTAAESGPGTTTTAAAATTTTTVTSHVSFFFRDAESSERRCDYNCTKASHHHHHHHVTGPGDHTFDVTFVMSFTLVCISRSFYSSLSSLLDAVTYVLLGSNRHQWGRQRLWGTVGTAAVAVVFMATGDRLSAGGYSAMFITCGTFALLATTVSAVFLKGPPGTDADTTPASSSQNSNNSSSASNSRPAKAKAKAGTGHASNILADLRSLLRQPAVRIFLVKILALGMFCGSSQNFTFWFLKELGAGQTVLAACLLTYCLSTLLVLRVSAHIIGRLGERRTMYLALPAYCIRFVVVSLIQEPWMAVLTGVLHGVTYSLLWAAASASTHLLSTPTTRTTCQAIAGAVYWDMGRGLGSMLTGRLFQTLGARWTLRAYGVTALLLLPVWCLLDRHWSLPALTSARDAEGRDLDGKERQTLQPLPTSPDPGPGKERREPLDCLSEGKEGKPSA
ncbi:uncharacterized protein LOC143298771 isoform X2 [Babylonia areolata]|uniref:uncharacterized protein LOC143298771 isoform X2 n=1 Tax=Babylonia areolata TaxID=304850 RepID=UPI003FD52FAB